MDDPATFRTFIQTFTDFLTVAIHTILYERRLYPQTSFLSARAYNYSVRQSRNPKVCEWINDAMVAVSAELFKATVARIVLVVYDTASQPLERYVFDTSRFPVVPPGEHGTPLVRTIVDGGQSQHQLVLPMVELEEQLRATMSRLSGCGAQLQALPESCSYNIAVELKDGSEPPIRHPQAWIPVQPDLQKADHVDDEVVGQQKTLDRGKTTPVRAVSAGEMLFELWIEEGQAKFTPGG